MKTWNLVNKKINQTASQDQECKQKTIFFSDKKQNIS